MALQSAFGARECTCMRMFAHANVRTCECPNMRRCVHAKVRTCEGAYMRRVVRAFACAHIRMRVHPVGTSRLSARGNAPPDSSLGQRPRLLERTGQGLKARPIACCRRNAPSRDPIATRHRHGMWLRTRPLADTNARGHDCSRIRLLADTTARGYDCSRIRMLADTNARGYECARGSERGNAPPDSSLGQRPRL